MSVEDIIKFYENETNLYRIEDVDDYCGIAHVQGVVKPNDSAKTKAQTLEAPTFLLEKSTKKKVVKNPNRKINPRK